MSQQVTELMFGIEPDEPEDDEDAEPEMIEHRASFSRTIYATEYYTVRFEAPEGLYGSELNDLAWDAYNRDDGNWTTGDYDDHGDTELDDIEVI